MPRQVSWGTPGRSEHYLVPRAKWAFVGPALMAGAAVLAVLLGLYVVGYRKPIAPGSVISAHAGFESRCAECHTPNRGVGNPRCQRCHDPSGAGRLTNAAHVFFGSGDAKKSAAAADLACARCHIDHKGRAATLSWVDEAHCRSCHFRSLSVHPEFAVLRQESVETPGIQFPHDKHVKEFAKQGISEKDSCLKCHEPTGRDIEPIGFDRHCASCHAKDGSVGAVEPIPLTEVMAPSGLLARGGRNNFRLDEFEESRGRISKTVVHHKDDWVLANLRKLRRDVDPEGFAAERGALQAREGQLVRRLALAAPLAALDADGLAARQAAVDTELAGVEARLAAQAGAGEPGLGLVRLDEVLAAAAAAGDASARTAADKLKADGAPLRDATAAALPAGELDQRRKELLGVLDAVAAADPSLKPRAEDLRRRLLALAPGEAGADVLARVRDQRKSERARLADEISLRASGITPPSSALLASEQKAVRDALADVRARLAELDLPATPPPSAEERTKREEALAVLVQACLKCHVRQGAALAHVRPARPVLIHARFVHAPHLLQADCARCHAGIEKSQESSELNFKGIASCRECHRPRQVFTDCQSCHLYHSPVGP
jgi:hypothetical protein